MGAAVALGLTLADRRALGLGLLTGAIWSAANLRALEGVIAAALLPRNHERDSRRVFLWFGAKLSIYVVAVLLLIIAPLPVAGMAHGLTVMLAAIVLAGLTTRSTADGKAPRRGDDAHA